jgi:hypothetical protein
MTYNFDPDLWYDNQRRVLEARHERGELSDTGLEAALAELDRRLDEMLDRLDGTYTIPE